MPKYYCSNNSTPQTITVIVLAAGGAHSPPAGGPIRQPGKTSNGAWARADLDIDSLQSSMPSQGCEGSESQILR